MNPRTRFISELVHHYSWENLWRSTSFHTSEIGKAVRSLPEEQRKLLEGLTPEDMKDLRPDESQFFPKQGGRYRVTD